MPFVSSGSKSYLWVTKVNKQAAEYGLKLHQSAFGGNHPLKEDARNLSFLVAYASASNAAATSAASCLALFVLLALSASCGGGTMSSPAPQQEQVSVNVQIVGTVTGPLQLAMSTSFQPAEWDYQFFTDNPDATTTLGNLLPQHVRLQGVSHGVPQTTATTWDFSTLDAITQPVLSVGDHSPEFQIAVAPAFMYDSQGNFLDPTYQQFAGYAQNLVRYYDLGGFTASDGSHVSPSPYPVTWWGIYNEPNFNHLDPTEYTHLYNAVVPAMQAVYPSLKFAAVELGDYSGLAQTIYPLSSAVLPRRWTFSQPTFIQPAISRIRMKQFS